MRTNNKRRFAPLFGIIAVVAIIGFLMVACKDEPEETPIPSAAAPTGKLYLEADYGRYVGYPLKAVAENISSASGSATLIWFDAAESGVYNNAQIAADREEETYGETEYDEYMAKIILSGTATATVDVLEDQIFELTKTGASANSSTLGTMIRPKTAGSYVAGLVDTAAYTEWENEQKDTDATSKTLSLPRFLFSDIIIIEEVSGLDTDIADFLGNWDLTTPFKPVGATTATYMEYLAIGDESFKLSSTFQNEGIHWEIKKWNQLTGTDLTKGGTTYDKGYKLLVNVVSNNGYTGFTSFNLYYHTVSSTVTIVRTNQKEDIVRSYKIKEKPESVPLKDPGE
jgi:hypothetical protein